MIGSLGLDSPFSSHVADGSSAIALPCPLALAVVLFRHGMSTASIATQANRSETDATQFAHGATTNYPRIPVTLSN